MSVEEKTKEDRESQFRRDFARDEVRRDSREHLNHFSSSRMIAETPFHAISRSRITSTSSRVGAGRSSAAVEEMKTNANESQWMEEEEM